MATLTVGSGSQYQFQTISAAVAASHDGDVVQVQAGTYVNDSAIINTKITLQGVGGMVKMVETNWLSNDKGILVTNTDVTIDHFEFSGAIGSSGNDAGVRYQGGNLVINNSYFHDNQNGLLANASTGTITINNSEFANNGTGDGITHNLYANEIAVLNINNSYFHDANLGNEIKSRAFQTNISNTRVYDNNSTSSWSIDIPVGGVANLSNNVIEQGPNSQNSNIISFGVEGLTHGLHDVNSLTMTNNTVVNDLANFSNLLQNFGGLPVTMTGTKVYSVGLGSVYNGTNVNETGTTILSARPVLDTSHPFDGTSSSSSAGGVSSGSATSGSAASGSAASGSAASGSAASGSAAGGGASAPPLSNVIVQDDHGGSVTGTANGDVIVLGTGGGNVTGGAGADTFVFTKLPTVASHITDFKVGTDQFDISTLLKNAGYLGPNAIADGYVKLVANSAGGTTASFDADGKGPGAAVTLAIIDHVSPTDLGAPAAASAPNVITQNNNGGSVTGTSGADTIVMGTGGGKVAGGAGSDVFDFNALPKSAAHITDFQHDVDKVDITDLIRASGYAGADPVGAGYLSLAANSAGGTTLYYDADGFGSHAQAVTLVTLDGVAPSSLSYNDLLFH